MEGDCLADEMEEKELELMGASIINMLDVVIRWYKSSKASVGARECKLWSR